MERTSREYGGVKHSSHLSFALNTFGLGIVSKGFTGKLLVSGITDVGESILCFPSAVCIGPSIVCLLCFL